VGDDVILDDAISLGRERLIKRGVVVLQLAALEAARLVGGRQGWLQTLAHRWVSNGLPVQLNFTKRNLFYSFEVLYKK
jgi:hypothetical protein